MSVIILDIDNTIARDDWRVHLINHDADTAFEKYHDYHSASVEDVVCNTHLFSDTPHEVVIFTARPRLYADITSQWLQDNGVPYKLLFMRDADDERHSADLKQGMLDVLRSIYDGEIAAAFDDRIDVCRMFERNGIKAVHIQIAEVNYDCPR